MNLHVELTDDGITVEATEIHPIEHDTAQRLLVELTLGLHRALHPADADG